MTNANETTQTTEQTETKEVKEVKVVEFSEKDAKRQKELMTAMINGEELTDAETLEFTSLARKKQQSKGLKQSRQTVNREKTPQELYVENVFNSEDGQAIREDYNLLNDTAFKKYASIMKLVKYDVEVFNNLLEANAISTELRVSSNEKTDNGKGYKSINQSVIKDVYRDIVKLVNVEEMKNGITQEDNDNNEQ